MGRTTLQEILKTAYKAYESSHLLPLHVRKAAHALMQRRAAELGGHVQACPEGRYQRQWYNSCRHCCCPRCNGIRIEQWLEKQKHRILACTHYHMIFTFPHELNRIWLLNVKAMTNLLFACVRDTLFAFCLDPRHIGGKPGIVVTLHTWGQTMLLHPHIHCLVTEGGLKNERWMETMQKGYLLPIKAVMMVFRGKLLDSLHKAIRKGTLTLPHEMTLQQWKNLRNKLGRKPWNGHIKERYNHGTGGVLIYLARYIRGRAVANRRIVSPTDKGVAFTYKTFARSKRDSMTPPQDQIIQRYLLHVPHPSTKVVRYYGLYAPAANDELACDLGCSDPLLLQGFVAKPRNLVHMHGHTTNNFFPRDNLYVQSSTPFLPGVSLPSLRIYRQSSGTVPWSESVC